MSSTQDVFMVIVPGIGFGGRYAPSGYKGGNSIEPPDNVSGKNHHTPNPPLGVAYLKLWNTCVFILLVGSIAVVVFEVEVDGHSLPLRFMESDLK